MAGELEWVGLLEHALDVVVSGVGRGERVDEGGGGPESDVGRLGAVRESAESLDVVGEVEGVGHGVGTFVVSGTFVLMVVGIGADGGWSAMPADVECRSEALSLEHFVGEIVVEIELENIEDRSDARRGLIADEAVRRETVRAVADTGAMMLALPEDLVTRLGVSVVDSITTTYADGRRGELPVSDALSIRIGDRRMATECIVVPEGAEPLVGVLVMERLDLVAEPVNQTLGPRPESPDRPLLRV